MHLVRDLRLVNECCRSYISGTTSIDDELSYLASHSALIVKDLPRLARYKGNHFDMKALRITRSSPIFGVTKMGSSSLYSS